MNKKNFLLANCLIFTAITNQNAFAVESREYEELKREIKTLERKYQDKIEDLENKVSELETESKADQVNLKNDSPASAYKSIFSNQFNPAIGLVLNGRYSQFSSESSEIAGFAIGEEGERGDEGFSLDETELNFAANVDDKFRAASTIALVEENGETEVEIEEAYIQTTANDYLPDGFSVKFGRSFWTLGYLNEHHAHSDDFADRPLNYRVFLNKAYNDTGVETSYVMPFANFYTEIGSGLFQGDDFPFGNSDGEGVNAWSAYVRVGDDLDHKTSWRFGLSTLNGKANNRASNEDSVYFSGDTDLYIADLRIVHAPTGNNKNKEVIFQAEYMLRDEDGTYEDQTAATGAVDFSENSSGFYAQAIYKFLPEYRIGVRYSELYSADTPTGLVGSSLDADGYDPKTYSVMADYTPSEFSRIRFQYNNEELGTTAKTDHQYILQYVMSLGAHAAHKY